MTLPRLLSQATALALGLATSSPATSNRIIRRDTNTQRSNERPVLRTIEAPVVLRQQPARRMAPIAWKMHWLRGGEREETLFALPRELVASNDGVYVADGGGLEVLAFAPDGKSRWKLGQKGGGPGEFRRIDDITFDKEGNVAVLDPENARVTLVSKSGALRSTYSTGSAGWPNGICMLADGSVATLTSSVDDYITVMDSAGRVRQQRAFPWKTERDPPSFLRAAHFARGLAQNQCWLATVFGFGIARIPAANAGNISTYPFIESVPAPVIRTVTSTQGNRGGQFLEKGDNAALSAFTYRDTLFVQFMGKADNTKPVLDLYDANGRYIESWRIPPLGDRVAYANGVLYMLRNASVAAELVAWKRVPPPSTGSKPGK